METWCGGGVKFSRDWNLEMYELIKVRVGASNVMGMQCLPYLHVVCVLLFSSFAQQNFAVALTL